MDILFIRHGETDINKANRLTGLTDDPLNDRGREQVKLLAPHLQYPGTAFFSSPARRAQETARTITASHTVDERLQEHDWGLYSGLSWQEVTSQYHDNLLDRQKKGWSWRPVGGESYLDVVTRVDDFLLEMEGANAERVICVTHLHTISAILMATIGYTPRGSDPFEICNASITHLRQTRDIRKIVSLNWRPTLFLEQELS